MKEPDALSRRDFLKLSGIGLGEVVLGPPVHTLSRLFGTQKEAPQQLSIDLSVIYSTHVDPAKTDYDHGWPTATRRAVDAMQYDVIGSDSMPSGKFTMALFAMLPLNKPNEYFTDRKHAEPLRIIGADIAPRPVYVTRIEKVLWKALRHIDSAFGEYSPVDINKNVQNRFDSYVRHEYAAGELGIAAGLAAYYALKKAGLKQESGSPDASDRSLKLAAKLSVAAAAVSTTYADAVYAINSAVVSRPGPGISALGGQLLDTVLHPLSDEFMFLTIRNARIALAVIDRSKKLMAERMKRQDAAPPVRAGIVLGNGHMFGEFPAEHTAFGLREPVESTEARLVNVMSTVTSRIINEVKHNLPSYPPELVYIAIRILLAEYNVYNIPQTRNRKEQGNYEMTEFIDPIDVLDAMIRQQVERAYHVTLPADIG